MKFINEGIYFLSLYINSPVSSLQVKYNNEVSNLKRDLALLFKFNDLGFLNHKKDLLRLMSNLYEPMRKLDAPVKTKNNIKKSF